MYNIVFYFMICTRIHIRVNSADADVFVIFSAVFCHKIYQLIIIIMVMNNSVIRMIIIAIIVFNEIRS